jgi:hypothetical protein
MRYEMKREPVDLLWRYEFFSDACVRLVRNVGLVLDLAGLADADEMGRRAARFLLTPPLRSEVWAEKSWRKDYCFVCFQSAWERVKDDPAKKECFFDLADYFRTWFGRRSADAQDMLIAAAIGVIQGCEGWRATERGGFGATGRNRSQAAAKHGNGKAGPARSISRVALACVRAAWASISARVRFRSRAQGGVGQPPPKGHGRPSPVNGAAAPIGEWCGHEHR